MKTIKGYLILLLLLIIPILSNAETGYIDTHVHLNEFLTRTSNQNKSGTNIDALAAAETIIKRMDEYSDIIEKAENENNKEIRKLYEAYLDVYNELCPIIIQLEQREKELIEVLKKIIINECECCYKLEKNKLKDCNCFWFKILKNIEKILNKKWEEIIRE